ncbi:MAG: 4Fe-4S binding protein, partial [Clostridiales bacterium]|nr:4Fe-4S binding protein [Clostridiales bacterium]
MKKPDKKAIKKIHVWIRAIIQLLYFLFIPSAYTAAFCGVKYIFTQLGSGASLELTSFVTTLIVLC